MVMADILKRDIKIEPRRLEVHNEQSFTVISVTPWLKLIETGNGSR
jgi:hypothetical protein